MQGKVTAELIGLAIINAFLVALIAGAAHDYIVAPTKARQAGDRSSGDDDPPSTQK